MNNQQMNQNGMVMGAPAYVNNGYGYYNGYNYGNNYGGMTYAAPKPQAMNNQPLTQEMVNILAQDGNEFNMKVDQKEIWRAICTHKHPGNGQGALVYNPDNDTYTCTICGETFKFFDGTKEDIDKAVNTLIDMMQTCKTIYLDAPNAMTEQYYQQIPLLRRFSSLWKHAMDNFSKYDNAANPLVPIGSNYGGFNAINQLLNNPYGYGYQNGMAAAPYYGQQPMMNPQAPMMNNQASYYGQQPMMNPQQQMAYPNSMNPMDQQNPLGYNAPAPGAIPTAPQPAAAPVAPAAQGGEIQQQKVYNV